MPGLVGAWYGRRGHSGVHAFFHLKGSNMATSKASAENELGYDDYADTVAFSQMMAIRAMSDHVEKTHDKDALDSMSSAVDSFTNLMKVVNHTKEG